MTALAFALRLAGMRQGLFGDELFTRDNTGGSLAGVFDGLDRNEVSPPFFFLLAWGAAQLGDPTTLIRLPSLVFGTATVPLVYTLGLRTVGGRAGLFAAGVVALSPFAIFYSTEARPYATMAFLVTLAAFALLRAVEGKHPGWWVVYAISACAALYTHYTAIFVVVATAAWAFWFHRSQLRTLVIVHLAIAIGFLPWLPSLLDQQGEQITLATIGSSQLSPGTFFDFVARLLVGYPVVELEDIPGPVGLALLALALAFALTAAVLRLLPKRRQRLPADPASLLVWILALATPVGLVAYTAVGSNLYGLRNLSASMPALALASGALVTSLKPPRLAAAISALALVGLGVGTSKSLGDDYRRPASPDVAHWIDQRAAPSDSVVTVIGKSPFLPPTEIYFDRKHTVVQANVNDREAWARAAHGASVFLVVPNAGAFRGVKRFAGPGGRFILRDRKAFPGLVGMAVGRYSGQAKFRLTRRAGREVIAVSPGKDIEVQPGVVTGVADGIAQTSGQLAVTGWAGDPRHQRVADLILGFSRGRLFAVNFFAIPRGDVAKANGEGLKRSGFALATATSSGATALDPSRLRVFAAIGNKASEIPLSEQATRTLADLR